MINKKNISIKSIKPFQETIVYLRSSSTCKFHIFYNINQKYAIIHLIDIKFKFAHIDPSFRESDIEVEDLYLNDIETILEPFFGIIVTKWKALSGSKSNYRRECLVVYSEDEILLAAINDILEYCNTRYITCV